MRQHIPVRKMSTSTNMTTACRPTMHCRVSGRSPNRQGLSERPRKRRSIMLEVRRTLITFMSFASAIAVAKAQSGSGTVSGIIQSIDGSPVSGAIVVLNIAAGANVKPFNVRTTTATTGIYTFSQVPAGTFQVCPQVKNSDLLPPCTWQAKQPTITVATGQSLQAPTILMNHGVQLKVRINDPGG